MRCFLYASALGAALACAAFADAPPDTVGTPVALKLDVVGTVRPRCGFAAAPPQTVSLGDLTKANELALAFQLDCNAIFTLRINADNGRFSNATAGNPGPELAGALDYAVALNIGTDLGSVQTECTSAALLAGSCAISSGDGVAIDADGSLTVRWEASQQKLIAGTYQETIHISVEVRS